MLKISSYVIEFPLQTGKEINIVLNGLPKHYY